MKEKKSLYNSSDDNNDKQNYAVNMKNKKSLFSLFYCFVNSQLYSSSYRVLLNLNRAEYVI